MTHNEVLSARAGLSISGGVMAAARACIRGLSVPQLLCPLPNPRAPSNSPLISSRELRALPPHSPSHTPLAIDSGAGEGFLEARRALSGCVLRKVSL